MRLAFARSRLRPAKSWAIGRRASGEVASKAIPNTASSSWSADEPNIDGWSVWRDQITDPLASNTRPDGSCKASRTGVPGGSPSAAETRSPPMAISVHRARGAAGFPSSVVTWIRAYSGIRALSLEGLGCRRSALPTKELRFALVTLLSAQNVDVLKCNSDERGHGCRFPLYGFSVEPSPGFISSGVALTTMKSIKGDALSSRRGDCVPRRSWIRTRTEILG